MEIFELTADELIKALLVMGPLFAAAWLVAGKLLEKYSEGDDFLD